MRCGTWGYRPVCPAGDYRWLSELNKNSADCQGMGSVTHRESHKSGVTVAQREDTEGEGCNHRVKIAFKWVFEISKNKLPLKKLNRQLICGLDGGQVQSCPVPPFLFISTSSIPWHHSFSHISFFLTHTLSQTHQHTCSYCTDTWVWIKVKLLFSYQLITVELENEQSPFAGRYLETKYCTWGLIPRAKQMAGSIFRGKN